MSVPPQVIQVKRKRNEESAVTYLRVDEINKRRQSGNFIYQRKDANAKTASDLGRVTPHSVRPPVIQTSKPGDELAPLRSIKNAARAAERAAAATAAGDGAAAVSENALAGGSQSQESASAPAPGPRRFHMSRSAMTTPLSMLQGGVGKRSRVSSPAVFVERTRKRKIDEALKKAAENESLTSETVPASAPEPEQQAAEVMEIDQPPAKLPKRPGTKKLPIAQTKKGAPSSLTEKWKDDMEQLARDMNEYALEQIGANLKRIEEQKKDYEPRLPGPTATSSQQVKFKPKAPARRYAERHPEAKAAAEPAPDVSMEDSSTEDEEDYVVETYVRVPASTLDATVPASHVGLLVFDTEPDVEFFYGQEQDSDDDEWEDEEDENAENYYTADYPDDEVDSGDEYDRDPYSYRTGNASDLEEYGEADDDYSIDEDKGERDEFSRVFGGTGRRPGL